VRECTQDPEPLRQEDVTRIVMQKIDYLRVTAFKCSMTKTELVHYCGSADHQTSVADMSTLNRPIRISDQR
jgi:hypothetical protein